MGPWLRTSAWLPPGLALGWLAVLARFVHGVGSLLAAWAATVSLVVLLARRPAASSGGPPETKSDPAAAPDHTSPTPADTTSPTTPQNGPTTSDMEEGAADGMAHSASAAENAATPTSDSPDSTSGHSSRADPAPPPGLAPGGTVSGATGRTEQLATAEVVVTLALRVLTAAEVASVLRVDEDVIITAIGNGELPGNRIGYHWRVDQGALARWLQGKYGLADLTGSPSPTELRTDPG